MKTTDIFLECVFSCLPFLFLFISSYGFQLPSCVISLLQNNFIPTLFHCVVIVIYITFLYVIVPTVQFMDVVLCDCFLN